MRGEKRETMAGELDICVRCVELHVASLRDKTGSRSFAELIQRLLGVTSLTDGKAVRTLAGSRVSKGSRIT